MKQDHVHSAIHKASLETSRFVSAHLRSEAHASNWPAHVTNSLHATYNKDEGFEAKVHSSHHAEALDHEYGTTSRQPSAAVRRVSNRTSEAETFFAGRVFRHLEDLL